jgi:hypothetical protein
MKSFGFSIDAERDYRMDGKLTVRGLTEGLPTFCDVLKSLEIPFDLMVSGEVVHHVPQDVLRDRQDLVALGCHGYSHSPGYLNRMRPRQKETEIERATTLIREVCGRPPTHFRAPNFSVDGKTIEIVGRLGYRIDSSVLPGRYVRRWRLIPLVDHRGAPIDPYTPDTAEFLRPGQSRILEVPVTPNPLAPGAPLGLGFLHSRGVQACLSALRQATGRYILFLAHSWEMTDWASSDAVRPWVRAASSGSTDRLGELLSVLDGWEFLNFDRIDAREVRRTVG